MFKLSSISASTEFQPLKESKTEIPSVELVAEFVKVELQEFRLYVMVPLPRPFQGMRMCWNRP